ncbi:unnamed protein product [Cylicocyclus nassatus]|uniref:Uncharacterized protein n=1 Tax=Cylicocyclus nassatus TaxID=53992 RepID=A0AA36HFR7_CYLNA|nr:unnamed protein product [Cylicocyclus nassatus]
MFVAIAFLSLVEVLLACSPLPNGQEKHLFLQITHMDKIPVQFAWGKAAIGVAATENEAKKNLKQAVKKAIVQTVKQEAKAAGVEHLVTDLGKQFKPTIYYYPLHCDNKITIKKDIGCQEKTVDWCCSATDNLIDKIEIPGHPNATKPISPVPEPYQQVIVDLSIANAVVAGWTKEQWAVKMANVEQNLRNNKDYGEAFRSVSVKVL